MKETKQLWEITINTKSCEIEAKPGTYVYDEELEIFINTADIYDLVKRDRIGRVNPVSPLIAYTENVHDIDRLALDMITAGIARNEAEILELQEENRNLEKMYEKKTPYRKESRS